eukprot:TRINITY_DN70_c0_g1_i6.p1 TRINITY_DN70_c0_g1~~TRINITY_DN70_c0_g1_i6.p1  ORF type:complete len:177 (+),score=33.99 TRINITY_DN70_c0_g1_i6:329-859(+)
MLVGGELVAKPTETYILMETVFFLVASGVYFVVDFVLTIAFALHIRQLNSQLNQSDVSVPYTASSETALMARRGVLVCMCSSLSFLMFWIAWGVGEMSSSYDILLYLRQLFAVLVMVVWMGLKVELDKIKVNSAVASSTQQVSFGSAGKPALMRIGHENLIPSPRSCPQCRRNGRK